MATWLRAELAPLLRRAENLSASLQAGAFGPATVKALAADLEALHGQIDALRADIERHEAALDKATVPASPARLAAAWRSTARALIASKDDAARLQWASLHVQEVTSTGPTSWRIAFWAAPEPVCVKGGEWYPKRWLCTLVVSALRAA